ncbi:MAG: SMI1/KNR4 family protein [Blastocatellia bacterium]
MDLEFYNLVLREAGVEFEPGLSEEEAQEVQAAHGFMFPPDLKKFLMFALPVSDGFVNWRDAGKEEITRLLAFPYERLFSKILYRSFWPEEWVKRPRAAKEAFAVARVEFEKVPALIPINRHRYIPDRPHERGNPVFSVFQHGFYYYGGNLAEGLRNEFRPLFGSAEFSLQRNLKRIDFWGNLAGKGI